MASTLAVFKTIFCAAWVLVSGVNRQSDPDCVCPCLARRRTCAPDGNCNKVNVALGKEASISSRYTEPGYTSGPASLAVDGNISTKSESCVHTLGNSDAIKDWWQVDLGDIYTVTDITVYHREGGYSPNPHSQRIAGVWVYVDETLCYKFPDSRSIGSRRKERDDITCSQPIRGRVVRFSKDGNIHHTHYSFINFCEVQVWVCKPGLYGERCDQNCSTRCNNFQCDNFNGQCLRACAEGYHGPDCEKCGQCQNDDVCDKDSGLCPNGCHPDYEGRFCKQRITSTPVTTSTVIPRTITFYNPATATANINYNVYNSSRLCKASNDDRNDKKYSDGEMAILGVAMALLGLAIGIVGFVMYDRFWTRQTTVTGYNQNL